MSKEKLFLESFKNLVQETNQERKNELAYKAAQILLDTKVFEDMPDFSTIDDPELEDELFYLYIWRKGRHFLEGAEQIYLEHSGNMKR